MVAAELEKNASQPYRTIAEQLGCSRTMVGRVAQELGINTKQRQVVTAIGRKIDPSKKVSERLAMAQGTIEGIAVGAEAMLKMHITSPLVRREATTLAYALANAAKRLKDILREEPR